ncbi:tropomyosin-1, isoforms 33/34 isoform X2 [Salmo salar]|uniref:Tropomyosin-1, isoforms 33/34 isoform X2 n=1 Tax=Salmo salar TaxID=8030 RepID=A0A1S3RFF7_SALSA|nr:tropomyosin-1, isoforms 33/34-like isoform X2 [Salmo salar]|eukprot:XP_014051040.1 PREDICTED: translation initiation factor IF-2-like [Salmo salar]
MISVVLLMCLLGFSLAAPTPDSGSDEVAAHANEALRWMELYRMYGSLGQLAAPAQPPMLNAPAAAPAAPAQDPKFFYPPPPMNSDEEAPVPHYGGYVRYYPYPGQAAPAAPVLPLNSDEVGEDEAAAEAEAEPAVDHAAEEPAVVDTATPVDPAAAAPVDPAVDVPIDVVIPAAVDIPATIDTVATDIIVVNPALIAPIDTTVVSGPSDPTLPVM